MEFWSEEFEEKLIELWKKHAWTCCLYDVSNKAFRDCVKKQKKRLTCFALIGCTLFNWVSCIADRRRQWSCVGEGGYSDATRLNSTSSWVELRRYKRAL